MFLNCVKIIVLSLTFSLISAAAHFEGTRCYIGGTHVGNRLENGDFSYNENLLRLTDPGFKERMEHTNEMSAFFQENASLIKSLDLGFQPSLDFGKVGVSKDLLFALVYAAFLKDDVELMKRTFAVTESAKRAEVLLFLKSHLNSANGGRSILNRRTLEHPLLRAFLEKEGSEEQLMNTAFDSVAPQSSLTISQYIESYLCDAQMK